MNTDNVRPLMVTATKPAASDETQKRQSDASPVVPQASIPKATPNTVETRTVQETTAAVAQQLETYLRSVGRLLQEMLKSEKSAPDSTGKTLNLGSFADRLLSKGSKPAFQSRKTSMARNTVIRRAKISSGRTICRAGRLRPRGSQSR